MMRGFDEAWTAVAIPRDGEVVSQELRPLLQGVYFQSLSQPVNLATLKESLENLLLFLVDQGRTSANCWAVDLFFAHSQGWESDWADQDLPQDFRDILTRMGEALQDTVKAPEIAHNFDALPEQILERVKKPPTA